MKILWTEESRNCLLEIYGYHSAHSSEKIAAGIIEKIIETTEILVLNPRIGQIEQLLKMRKNGYRYLICGNYKIIYWISKSNIFIATVFDTRQNPTKLNQLKLK